VASTAAYCSFIFSTMRQHIYYKLCLILRNKLLILLVLCSCYSCQNSSNYKSYSILPDSRRPEYQITPSKNRR
jgi:hypothetical protein